jgi:hypothetical protein
MTKNAERAESAFQALCCFAKQNAQNEISEEVMRDLISNLGHYARNSLGLEREVVIRLFANSIGAWSAEDASDNGEPHHNDSVALLVRASI